jgi:hypothetical protein
MRKLAFAPRGHPQARQPRPELLEARLLLASGAALTTPLPATSAVISAADRPLPMSFEANRGQTDSHVSVLTRGAVMPPIQPERPTTNRSRAVFLSAPRSVTSAKMRCRLGHQP